MKYVIGLLLVGLIVAHQDFWNWQRYTPLVLGFIPIGLAWHVGISLAAGLLGALAVRYWWPAEVDELEAEAEAEIEIERLSNRPPGREHA